MDSNEHVPAPPRHAGLTGESLRRGQQWEAHLDPKARAGTAVVGAGVVEGHGAAVAADQFPDDGQTQSGAARIAAVS